MRSEGKETRKGRFEDWSSGLETDDRLLRIYNGRTW